MEGNILKMKSELSSPVQYALPMGENLLKLNEYLGKKISFEFKGQINDIYDGKLIKKSYGQGYSYPNFIKLAQCDSCILSPEKCHFDKGTCREPEWGKKNCMIPHYIYLSITSGVKIGITRHTQTPTRWIDQGAVKALKLVEVETRHISGLIEAEVKKTMNDKTNWRNMLKGEFIDVDLYEEKERIFNEFDYLFDDYNAIESEDDEVNIEYPILEVPKKISSFSFDKKPLIEGTLTGIKGQYLIFDNGVLNMRKHQGYYLYFKG